MCTSWTSIIGTLSCFYCALRQWRRGRIALNYNTTKIERKREKKKNGENIKTSKNNSKKSKKNQKLQNNEKLEEKKTWTLKVALRPSGVLLVCCVLWLSCACLCGCLVLCCVGGGGVCVSVGAVCTFKTFPWYHCTRKTHKSGGLGQCDRAASPALRSVDNTR